MNVFYCNIIHARPGERQRESVCVCVCVSGEVVERKREAETEDDHVRDAVCTKLGGVWRQKGRDTTAVQR